MRRSLLISTAASILFLGGCAEHATAPGKSAEPVTRRDSGGFLAGSGSIVAPPRGDENESATTTSVAADTTSRGGFLAGSGS